MDAERLPYAFACPCALVVFDMRGAAAGSPVRCPRCGRLFLAGPGPEAPPTAIGGPVEPMLPARGRAERTTRAPRADLAAGAPPRASTPRSPGRTEPVPATPPVSASRLAARYMFLWTLFVAIVFGSWLAYHLIGGTARIEWGRLPWWAWLAGIGGAALAGLLLWGVHTYYFVHRPRVQRERLRAMREARQRRRASSEPATGEPR